ncbi:unnamed protein product [Closterium sp. Yama58-4]|nr:unnamed protein product [Closterium sp. Yama58-4]
MHFRTTPVQSTHPSAPAKLNPANLDLVLTLFAIAWRHFAQHGIACVDCSPAAGYPLGACLPPLPVLSAKRRVTPVRAAAAVAAPPATAAAVKAGALTDVAQAVYSRVVPAGFAAGLGLTEVSVVLFLRESIVGLATLIVIYCAPRICRALNHVWGTYVMSDEEVTEEEFEDSMFGALVRPMQFALASAFLTRHLHVLVPALRQAGQAALMARARGVALVVAAAWFAIGWKDRILKLVAARHPDDKPVLANVSAVLTLLLRAVAGITIADMFGVSLKSLIAIGGISGFALAFASEKIVTTSLAGWCCS